MDMREAIATELRVRAAIARAKGPELQRAAGVSRSTQQRHFGGQRDISVPDFVAYCSLLGVGVGEVVRAAQDRLVANGDEIALD